MSATNGDGEFIAVTDVDWYRDGLLTVEARELSPNWTSRGQVWNAEVTLETTCIDVGGCGDHQFIA